MSNSPKITLGNFFAPDTPVMGIDTGPDPEDLVRRDQWGRPLIQLPGGGERAYSRASSFGNVIDDRTFLELWIQRQIARGLAMSPDLIERIRNIGDPDADPATKSKKNRVLNSINEVAQDRAGSNVKSTLGTAIHLGTELVDKGLPLDELSPLVRERALAYWRFCQEEGIRPTSVEVFGVEDVHEVAGTWDRTGWWRRKHKIVDVKTSGSMDFAGIVFAVQLAEYAHMCAYDLATGQRTPHEVMDLEQAIIVHVGREAGSPVELFEVDITVGWEYAKLVAEVKRARKEGKHAIREPRDLDLISQRIIACTTEAELFAEFQANGGAWRQSHRDLASWARTELKTLTS